MRDGGVRAVSANGVLGDPTRASAAAGAELIELRAVTARVRGAWMRAQWSA